MSELISVIIPVYNVEKYLSSCIESIINQTYKNLEILLINDGSTDNSGSICEKFAETDKRIKVYNKENGGLSDARNYGFSVSSGGYVAFVDSDDTVDNTFIETLYNLCQKYDSDVSLVYFKRVFEDGLDRDFTNEIIFEKCFNSVDILYKYYDTEIGPNITIACNKLYKRELFNNIKYPVGKLNEDEATTYKVLFSANKIAVSSKKLYYYLQRTGSIMRGKFSEKNLDVLEFIEEKSDFFLKKGLYELYELNKIYYVKLLIHLYLSAKKGKIEKSNLQKLRIKFKSEIDDVLKYKSVSTSEKTDLKLAKTSLSLYNIKRYICNKVAGGKRKLKILLKHFAEKYKFTYLLMMKLKSVNLIEYYRHYNEYKKIKDKLSLIHKAGKKAVLFISTPSHGNLGDQAIVYSQYLFFKDLDITDSICEINEYLYDLYQTKIKRQVHKDDLIVIDGGGNLGTLWTVPENRMLNVIMRFLKNTIIIFPQSAYFCNNAYGKHELEKVKRIYNNHSNLHIMFRENYSFELMRKVIEKNVYYTPDIVLLNNLITFPEVKRENIVMMSRNDHEGQSSEIIARLADKLCEQGGLPLVKIDNVLYKNIFSDIREEELLKQLRTIAGAKLLITDRLHGMIFAVITGTPCIVLDNINHKISGVYESWLKDIKSIYFIKNQYDIDYEKINSMLEQKTPYYNNSAIKAEFEPIVKLCNQILS